MEPMETVQFELPKSMVASLNEAVASGGYHSHNEVAQVALARWDMQRKISLELLREEIKKGLESGIAEPFTIEELLAEARARKASKTHG